jgi:hypothetical protein
MGDSVIQGFVFQSVDDHERNDTICQILRRAPVSDAERLDMGAAFTVAFGDGQVMTAYSSELHPWYPT